MVGVQELKNNCNNSEKEPKVEGIIMKPKIVRDRIPEIISDSGKKPISELSRRLGQSPQNFTKKLQRETVTTDELMDIGNVLGVKFEQSFTLETGEKLSISNES